MPGDIAFNAFRVMGMVHRLKANATLTFYLFIEKI